MAATIFGRRIRFPRIPVFRVFYSLTYTLLYLVTLVFLAITPITMIYGSIQQAALQYTVMIGTAYVLTAILAIFIYSSRIYTNRTTLSAVGKAYIPIEDGEIGKMVRKMIVKQLERSAIVAWESRPRDLYGEILLAEQEGILPPETSGVTKHDYTVGLEIPVDPQKPPWGDVQHPGWSSPSHTDDNRTPDVQFDNVIAELPHLIEARAVSLAPPDPNLTPVQGEARIADPSVVDLLKRPSNMAVREYLTQLSYLGLVATEVGRTFLSRYEKARFSGKPVPIDDFNMLMNAFAGLLAGMTALEPQIIDQIRTQTAEREQDLGVEVPSLSLPSPDSRRSALSSPSRAPGHQSPQSGVNSPVTAREAQSSRAPTPYMQQAIESTESIGSVLRTSPEQDFENGRAFGSSTTLSSDLPSDAGSVVRYDMDDGND